MTGPRGPKGEKGLAGPQGRRGLSGKDGQNGAPATCVYCLKKENETSPYDYWLPPQIPSILNHFRFPNQHSRFGSFSIKLEEGSADHRPGGRQLAASVRGNRLSPADNRMGARRRKANRLGQMERQLQSRSSNQYHHDQPYPHGNLYLHR